MSTTGRAAEAAPAASDVAASLRDAGFVRLVARADGDALAATGLLARALSDAGVPFEASVARTDAEATRRLDDQNGQQLSVGLAAAGVDAIRDGDRHGDDRHGADRPASATAYEVARELDADPDPVLALAGAVAAGRTPGDGETAELLDAAADRIERRPGVALPTDDRADGLAHSTLVHAGFSGRPDDAGRLVAETRAGIEDDSADDPLDTKTGRRQFASVVAVEAAGDGAATGRAATALERALRPYATPDGPFATVGGHADVLDALAREQPGTAIALALGGDVREVALDAWRTHARRAHAGLREATTGRYDGLFVGRVEDAPVETTARLLADFRSPELVALVVADGEAAVATDESTAVVTDESKAVVTDESAPTDALRAAAGSLDGETSVGPRGGYATFDGEPEEFVAAFREEQ